jgi:curli biogenesis system outer membrane secretion channel CsgG
MKKSNLFLWLMLVAVLAFGMIVTGCALLPSGLLGNVVTTEALHSFNEARGIKSATDTISKKMVSTLPNGVGLAILSVESNDPNESSYVISELEYALVNSGRFPVATRSSVDAVMKEQNFQLSGNVSDSDAVSIGRMAGVSIVITGNVNKTSTTNTLAVRAIDVQTGNILLMERDSFR